MRRISTKQILRTYSEHNNEKLLITEKIIKIIETQKETLILIFQVKPV